MLSRFVVILSLFATLIGVAAPASAQNLTLAGQFGTTFQSETAPVFAAEVGIGLIPGLSLYGTFGRMQDVTPGDVANVFDALNPVVDVSIPALYGIGGIRIAAPAGPIRPYGVAGVGFARLSADVDVFGIDITNLIEDQIGFGLDANELAYELGGGLMFSVGPAAFVDAGYRYMRLNASGFDVSRVYGGIGLRF